MEEKKIENEKKKEYLLSYQKSLKREERILEEIQELRASKMFPSSVSDGMPHGCGNKDLSDYIVVIDEMIERLKKERLAGAIARDKIDRSIRALKSNTEQEVLRLRYIKGLKWENVAVESGYGWTHIHRIHSNALEHIKME